MPKYEIYTLFWGFRDTPGNRGKKLLRSHSLLLIQVRIAAGLESIPAVVGQRI